jgi:predicted metal-dependent phosphoesterase TrpH
MKLDLHVHSSFSVDGKYSPKDIIKHAKKIKLDGIAITDHNEIKGSLEAVKIAKNMKDFVVIPGMEVSSEDGHVLALGITESIERGLKTKDTIERITKLGGLPIAPHPYRFWSGLGKDVVRNHNFKALEVVNNRSLKKHNRKAEKLADELDVGRTGGSDSHDLEHIGRAYTELELTTYNVDDILQEIEKKRSQGKGKNRSPAGTVGYTIKCVFLWLGRGMKKM